MSLLILHGGVVAAQGVRTEVISDAVDCSSCRIEVHQLRTLDVVESSRDGFPSAIRLDKLGRIWVLRRGDVPVVFDSTGRAIRSIGRYGSGPGEYRNATEIIAVSPDTTVVLDGTTRRASYLNRTFTVVRTVPIPLPMRGAVVLSWPDRVVTSGPSGGGNAGGRLLHGISFKASPASIVRSFGADDRESEGFPRSNHSLTEPVSGMFWAGWMYGYRLSQFAQDGRIVRMLERRPEWFPEPHFGGFGTPTRPPPSLLVDLQQDTGGLLWIFIRVPSESWKSAWPDLPPGTREVSSQSIAMEKMYDTIVEVIDPKSAKVYARTRLKGYVIGTLPGLRGATYSVDDATGEDRVTIVSFSIVGR